jgi:hypothetical protein
MGITSTFSLINKHPHSISIVLQKPVVVEDVKILPKIHISVVYVSVIGTHFGANDM